MPTQPDEQRAAMRDVLGPLLNKFGELQWQSGRSLRVSHEDLHDAFEAVISAAALSALPAGGGWKPIESAPKDGTEIIGWRDGDVRVCSWEPLDNPVAAHWGIAGTWHRRAVASGKSLMGGNFVPTHYLTLPAAPQQQEEPK